MVAVARLAVFTGINLAGWGDIAQVFIALAAVAALLGAVAQIRVTHALARRALSYQYADRFNEPKMAERIAEYQKYWMEHEYSEWWTAAHRHDAYAQGLLIVPNLVEEFAAAYNRELLDRDIAAMFLGTTVAVLWKQSGKLVEGARRDRDNWVYAEWEAMLPDSKSRLDARRDHPKQGRAISS